MMTTEQGPYHQKRRPPEVARFLRQFSVDDRHEVTNSLLDAGLRSYSGWSGETKEKLDTLLRQQIGTFFEQHGHGIRQTSPSTMGAVRADADDANKYQGVVPTPRARSEEKQFEGKRHVIKTTEKMTTSVKRKVHTNSTHKLGPVEERHPTHKSSAKVFDLSGSTYLYDRGLHPTNDLDPVINTNVSDVRADIRHRRHDARTNYGKFEGPEFIFVGHDFETIRRKNGHKPPKPVEPFETRLQSDSRVEENGTLHQVTPEEVIVYPSETIYPERTDLGTQTETITQPEPPTYVDKVIETDQLPEKKKVSTLDVAVEARTLAPPTEHQGTNTMPILSLNAVETQTDEASPKDSADRSTLTDHQEQEALQKELWREQTTRAIHEAVMIALATQLESLSTDRVAKARTTGAQTDLAQLRDHEMQSECVTSSVAATQSDFPSIPHSSSLSNDPPKAVSIVQKTRQHRFVANFDDEEHTAVESDFEVGASEVHHYTVSSELRHSTSGEYDFGWKHTNDIERNTIVSKDAMGNESVIRVFSPEFVFELKQIIVATRGARLSKEEIRSAMATSHEEELDHCGFINLYRSLLVMYHLNR